MRQQYLKIHSFEIMMRFCSSSQLNHQPPNCVHTRNLSSSGIPQMKRLEVIDGELAAALREHRPEH